MHRNSTLSRIALVKSRQERKVIPKRRSQQRLDRSIPRARSLVLPLLFPVFIKIPRDSPCVPSPFLTVCAGHRHTRRATRDRYEPLSSDRPRHHHRDAMLRDLPLARWRASRSLRVSTLRFCSKVSHAYRSQAVFLCLLYALLLIHNTLCGTKTYACIPSALCSSHRDFAARNPFVKWDWNDCKI